MSSDSIRHAPFGANASFDFGPPGAPAGFAIPASETPTQNLFIGCRPTGHAAWALLPFFSPQANGPQPLPSGRFGRFLAWAGDKWMIGPLVFKCCTPFETDSNSDDRFLYAPVVCAYLEYDNSHSDDGAELIFGLSGDAQLLETPELVGFRFGNSHGYATGRSEEVALVRGSEIFGADIGPATALHFRVPPHEKRIFPLVLGFFHPAAYSTTFLPDLTSILEYGVSQHSRYVALTDKRDAEFMRSPLSAVEKSRAAREVRAWLAQTRRLVDEPEIDLTPLQRMNQHVTGTA